jgi:hypothetical protein
MGKAAVFAGAGASIGSVLVALLARRLLTFEELDRINGLFVLGPVWLLILCGAPFASGVVGGLAAKTRTSMSASVGGYLVVLATSLLILGNPYVTLGNVLGVVALSGVLVGAGHMVGARAAPAGWAR